MKTVMAFGTFDGMHPGHDFFLAEARKLGDRLVVSLARDVVVLKLKGKPPRRGEEARREGLAESSSVDEVIYGDREIGSWASVESLQPNVIAFGYDQKELKQEFINWLAVKGNKIELVDIAPFHPELYKSSLLYD